jgi:hypothetical protein
MLFPGLFGAHGKAIILDGRAPAGIWRWFA